jgi:tetratricopeptide (TPR) repeat protein
MPNELTREHARLLYDLATNSQRTGNFVHTIQVTEKLVEINEPFYTPFALAAQSQCYNTLGRRDLETATFKRISGLPEEQQRLLNPAYLALCYQRIGDLKRAKKINTEILELTPNDPSVIAALAELSLLEHRPEEAEHWASKLRARGEAPYQILGRMIGALVLILNRRDDEAGKELEWVGQFLMSTGSVQLQAWDYRDLQPMATEITGPPRPGISGMFHSLFDALTGKISVPQFTEEWKKVAPAA